MERVLYLQRFKSNLISDGAVLNVVVLVWKHIQQRHHLVGSHAAFREEDQERARPTHFQIVGQQAGDGFVDQRLGDGVARETGFQGVGAKLHAELDSVFAQLAKTETERAVK